MNAQHLNDELLDDMLMADALMGGELDQFRRAAVIAAVDAMKNPLLKQLALKELGVNNPGAVMRAEPSSN